MNNVLLRGLKAIASWLHNKAKFGLSFFRIGIKIDSFVYRLFCFILAAISENENAFRTRVSTYSGHDNILKQREIIHKVFVLCFHTKDDL